MLRELIADNETVVDTIKAGLFAAQQANDDAAAGLLTDRLAYHEKQIWMMKSTLAA